MRPQVCADDKAGADSALRCKVFLVEKRSVANRMWTSSNIPEAGCTVVLQFCGAQIDLFDRLRQRAWSAFDGAHAGFVAALQG